MQYLHNSLVHDAQTSNETMQTNDGEDVDRHLGRRIFQMHLLVWKWQNSDSNFPETCSYESSGSVQMLAWGWTGAKPLPEPIMTQLTDGGGTTGRRVEHVAAIWLCKKQLLKTCLPHFFKQSSNIAKVNSDALGVWEHISWYVAIKQTFLIKSNYRTTCLSRWHSVTVIRSV